MKFSAAAVLAAAAGASAHYGGNATVVTEVVTAYTTYCPGPTQITHGDKTYTVTEATTLTITDCPCTITKPVITTSAVVCHNKENCGGSYNSTVPTGPYNTPVVPTATVVPPGGKPGSNPGYPAGNPAGNVPAAPAGTGAPPAGTQPGSPSSVPTAGSGKVAVLSGASLAAVVGVAAFLL